VEQALLEQGSEAGVSAGEVAEESSGNEEKVDDKKDRYRRMTGNSCGVSYGAFVKVEEDFADSAEIEAVGEALGGEGVVQQRGELAIDADREEKRKDEIEDVGPEERGKTAQSEGQAVEEDVVAFKHDCWNL
jgi:hypothetical protein